MIIHLKSFLGEGELQSKNVNFQNRGKIFKYKKKVSAEITHLGFLTLPWEIMKLNQPFFLITTPQGKKHIKKVIFQW